MIRYDLAQRRAAWADSVPSDAIPEDLSLRFNLVPRGHSFFETDSFEIDGKPQTPGGTILSLDWYFAHSMRMTLVNVIGGLQTLQSELEEELSDCVDRLTDVDLHLHGSPRLERLAFAVRSKLGDRALVPSLEIDSQVRRSVLSALALAGERRSLRRAMRALAKQRLDMPLTVDESKAVASKAWRAVAEAELAVAIEELGLASMLSITPSKLRLLRRVCSNSPDIPTETAIAQAREVRRQELLRDLSRPEGGPGLAPHVSFEAARTRLGVFEAARLRDEPPANSVAHALAVLRTTTAELRGATVKELGAAILLWEHPARDEWRRTVIGERIVKAERRPNKWHYLTALLDKLTPKLNPNSRNAKSQKAEWFAYLRSLRAANR